MKKTPKFKAADMVSFRFTKSHKETHSGVIVGLWHGASKNIVYEIASMNHGMCSYSIGEDCIVKKLN